MHIKRMQVYSDDPSPRRPIFKNMPPVVLWLAGAIIAVTLIQFLASPGLENWMFTVAAIIGGPDFAGIDRPYGPLAPLGLHVFLHGDVFHLAMNMWALVALGPIVARAFGPTGRGMAGFIVFFFVCAVGGALFQLYIFALQGDSGVAIGASSAISGLLPALGWLRGGWHGAVRASMIWLLINIALAFLGDGLPINIAWAAHIGGLGAGFLFPFLLAFARRR